VPRAICVLSTIIVSTFVFAFFAVGMRLLGKSELTAVTAH
jgi:hypothetical protein